MLLGLLAVIQQTPPPPPPQHIVVTLEQTGAMSETKKTLIAAGVGALFGVFSTVLVELLKPVVVRWRDKSILKSRIDAELRDNLKVLKQTLQILENDKANPKEFNRYPAWNTADPVIESLHTDIYDLTVEKNKELLSELPSFRKLNTFFENAKHSLSAVHSSANGQMGITTDYDHAIGYLEKAIAAGQSYLDMG